MAVDYRTLLGKMSEAKYPTSSARSAGAVQLQKTIAQTPASSASLSLAQNLGASLSKLQQSKELQRRETQAKTLEAQGQNALVRKKEEVIIKGAGLEAGTQEANIDNVKKLAQIDSNAKRQLYDMRRQFTQDEMGRKFSNDRQLSDYMKLSAGSDEQFQNYAQNLSIAYDRKKQVSETALSKITDQMNADANEAQLIQDQINQRQIKGAEMEQARILLEKKLTQINYLKKLEVRMQRRVAEDRIEAQNKLMKTQAIGQIGGAIIGGVAGGIATGGNPGGMAAGASIGSPVGGGIASIIGSR